MKSSLNIEVVIPLIQVYKPEKHIESYVQDAIDELLSLGKKLEFELLDLGKFHASIYLIENYRPFSGQNFSESNAIVFQVIVPNNYRYYGVRTNSTREVSEEEKMKLFKRAVSDEFRLKVFYFLIISQIAKPGAIKSRKGDVYVDNTLENYAYSSISIHRESLDDVEELKWSTYKSLKFQQVWDWYQKNSFSFQRHSKSKTERALNAFTHLFRDSLEGNEFDLFWSLVGIEALYCSDNECSSDKILEGIQSYLGKTTDHEEMLKQMYHFNSRLVHGDLDILPVHYELEDGESEEFMQSLYDSTILAVAILTSTLQKMVIEDIRDLKFN